MKNYIQYIRGQFSFSMKPYLLSFLFEELNQTKWRQPVLYHDKLQKKENISHKETFEMKYEILNSRFFLVVLQKKRRRIREFWMEVIVKLTVNIIWWISLKNAYRIFSSFVSLHSCLWHSLYQFNDGGKYTIFLHTFVQLFLWLYNRKCKWI